MEQKVEVDGCSIHFDVRGEGDPVVLVQGVGLGGDGWLPQVEALRARYRCITFDHRGIGRSQPVPRTLTVDRVASDTLAVMDAAGAGPVHLVGHSLGGCVALALALREPKRVRSLALLCTSAYGADATRLTLPTLLLWLQTRIGSAKGPRFAASSVPCQFPEMSCAYRVGPDRSANAVTNRTHQFIDDLRQLLDRRRNIDDRPDGRLFASEA